MKKIALASAISATLLLSSQASATFVVFSWADAIKAHALSIYDEVVHSEKIVEMMAKMSNDYTLAAADILAKQQRAAADLSRSSQVDVDIENMRRLAEQQAMPSETCGAAIGMAAVANSECTKPVITQSIIKSNQRISTGQSPSSSSTGSTGSNSNGSETSTGSTSNSGDAASGNEGGTETASNNQNAPYAYFGNKMTRKGLEQKLSEIYKDRWDRMTDEQKDSLTYNIYGTPVGKAAHPAARQQISQALKITDSVTDYSSSASADSTAKTSTAPSSISDMDKYQKSSDMLMGAGSYTLSYDDLESLSDFISLNFPPHLADLDSQAGTAILEKNKLDDLRALSAKSVVDAMYLSNVGEMTSLDPENAPSSFQAINELVTEVSSISPDGSSGLLTEAISSSEASSWKTYAMTERIKLYLSYKELERSLREEAFWAMVLLDKIDNIEYEPYGDL